MVFIPSIVYGKKTRNFSLVLTINSFIILTSKLENLDSMWGKEVLLSREM